MFFKGIVKKWLLKCLSAIVVMIIFLDIFMAFFIQHFFYNNIKNSAINRAKAVSNIFTQSANISQDEFKRKICNYVINFQDHNFLSVTAFDRDNNTILSVKNSPLSDDLLNESSGSETSENEDSAAINDFLFNEQTQDYEEAKTSEQYIAYQKSKLNNGRKVLALTRALMDDKGNFIGAVRYVISLDIIDRVTFISILASFLVCLIMILFIIISNLFFMKSVALPIREVSKISRKIALGDFNARLTKRYDDEIGELCDTVNFMAQKLLESEKMKNDFISSISHELRTPLTAIKGWAETIQLCETKEDKMYEKGLNIIIHESERLSGIVEELLDFSKLQSSRMILKLDKIDILAEISEAVYMFRKRANEENKILLYSEPENLSPVLGDKNRLKQVFINVIDNAIKYTPEGGVINVDTKEENGFIYITISDNGCGIPEVHLPRVKEKFYKANTAQKGSGIGLAVANDIVLLHEGALEIKSEENIGTVVTISIPTAKSEDTSKDETIK